MEAARWTWRLSAYDERVHAFPSDERASLIEAVCTHTVPYAKAPRTHSGPRCVSCLLIVGDVLTAVDNPGDKSR
ncbi:MULTISPECIES: hypothetical protein [Actinokineospora]|uniref:Uncharacterized protein n=1 Tax=Actinokineospora fastidiosa TaxID=1816 RepID=A0A918G5B4_9PSEU|nr:MULTISPECIES: hypothetical protein [Actinokineospora]UVS82631.1 hypothetical protein Actkin_06405 [Actinokineospora sp. UTMC 2448]GGS19662.1 hypothetical protein GCM10010171_10340 [Actinokineospora fastidiosa]